MVVKRDCKEFFEQVKVRNDEACALACTELLNQYHAEVMASLSANSISIDESSPATEERPVFASLDSLEEALQQIESAFEQTGPSGDQNVRALLYEKFRSQIAFEAGNHFVSLATKKTKMNIVLLQQNFNSLEKQLADGKKESQEELDFLRDTLKGKERNLCDLQAEK